ncbi:MAG: YybH family protein [Acidobacteriota bacterium]
MKNASKSLLVAAVLCLSWALVLGQEKTGLKRVDVAAEQTALMKIDAEFSAFTAEHGMGLGFQKYFADDATLFPDRAEPVSGKHSISAFLARASEGDKSVFSWTPARAEVAHSGELGFTFGNYEVKGTGPDGKPRTQRGKYVSIWKKQADGSWKVVVDIGNSSP